MGSAALHGRTQADWSSRWSTTIGSRIRSSSLRAFPSVPWLPNSAG